MAGKTLTTDSDTYELGERIGIGGMAEVFSACAVSSGARVAVKCILPSLAADEEFIKMFIDEARIGALLGHDNLVAVLDLGKSGETYFMVQEYVDGCPAAVLFDKVSPRERDALVCHVVWRVALALDHLHTLVDHNGLAATVVHRGVCPDNILVGVDGVPRLIDLGVARPARHLRASKTQAGILKGRLAFLSPEQVRGLPFDGRSDLFALGIVLYEWLAGRRAYPSTDSPFELLMHVRNGDIVPLREVRPDVPEALERIVVRALALDPDDRCATAAAMANDLAEAARVCGLERSTAAVAAAMGRGSPTGRLDSVLDDLDAVPSGRPQG